MSYFLFKQRDKARMPPSPEHFNWEPPFKGREVSSAHPAVLDAYEKGFIDGALETIQQLRNRFDLSQTPEIEAFLTDVNEKMQK